MYRTSELEHFGPLAPLLADRYRIEGELGRGAMARVFVARDLRHDRKVAIKIIEPELAAHLGTARFLREIRLTAAVQHPHILPLFDSGEAEGVLFYVMPHVTGGSLRSRLGVEKQLPVQDAIALTIKIARALAFVHAQGIVHRDIKPENILLQGGDPLLADFGIALPSGSQSSDDRLTATGLSIGTPQYMSPEQAAGEREVGPQSDIYSLAVLCYELLTGQPAFTAPSAQALLARVRFDVPHSIRTVRAGVSAQLEAVIIRALEKNPADRFESADAFAEALERAMTTSRRPSVWRAPVLFGAVSIAAIALIIAVGITVSWGRKPGEPLPRHQKITTSGNAVLGTLSPDGQLLAYVARVDDSVLVLVQDLSGSTPTRIASLPGGYPGVVTLEWSPNGREILVGGRAGALLFPRLGGPARRLTLPAMGTAAWAYWLPDGRHVSLHEASDHRVRIIDLDSGTLDSVAVKGSFAWLTEGSWSPNGAFFAALTQTAAPLRWEIRTCSRDGHTIVVVTDTLPLGSPRWADDGRALYYARGTNAIWRVSISSTGTAVSSPVQVLSDLGMLSERLRVVQFDISRDHRLVYSRGERYSNLYLLDAAPDGSYRPFELTRGTLLRWSPAISPNGRWLAFAQQGDGGSELYRMPADGGEPTRLTYGARVQVESRIAWSGDGSEIAFESIRQGNPQVWHVRVSDGEARPVPGTEMSVVTSHLSWAPGSRIAYQSFDHQNLLLVDPATNAQRALVDTVGEGSLFSPIYSPDGSRLIALWANPNDANDGLFEFDLAHGTRRKLSARVLFFPRGWSHDGRYIYGQVPLLPMIYRVPATGGVMEPALSPPFRTADCVPVERRQHQAFVCAAFAFYSDVYSVDDFDGQRQ